MYTRFALCLIALAITSILGGPPEEAACAFASEPRNNGSSSAAYGQTPAASQAKQQDGQGNDHSQWLQEHSPLRTLKVHGHESWKATTVRKTQIKVKGYGRIRMQDLSAFKYRLMPNRALIRALNPAFNASASNIAWDSGDDVTLEGDEVELEMVFIQGKTAVLQLFGEATIWSSAVVVDIGKGGSAEILDGGGQGSLTISAEKKLSVVCRGSTQFRVSGFYSVFADEPGTLVSATKCDTVASGGEAAIAATDCRFVQAAGNSRMRAENVKEASATDHGVIELHGQAQSCWTLNQGQIITSKSAAKAPTKRGSAGNGQAEKSGTRAQCGTTSRVSQLDFREEGGDETSWKIWDNLKRR